MVITSLKACQLLSRTLIYFDKKEKVAIVAASKAVLILMTLQKNLIFTYANFLLEHQ